MFDEKLHEFNWPFISLFLINQQRDSCEMLTEYMSVVKHGTIHVVRNRFFGMAPSLFELYDTSALRQTVEARDGLSLYLPQLATRVTNLACIIRKRPGSDDFARHKVASRMMAV
jgi:hypothetical protein